MALTITDVVPDPEATRVVVGLSADAAFPYVELQRSNDGARTWLTVRGENAANWTTTYVPAPRTVYDYEAPFDVPVRYRARAWSADFLTATPFTIMTRSYVLASPPGRRWVLHAISDATNRVRALTRSAPADKRGIAQGTFYALGRPDPIITSDVRRSRVGTFAFLANDLDEYDAFTALAESADVLCVRAPGAHWWGMRYVALGNASWTRIEDRPDDAWDVEMDWTEVSNPPIPIAPAGATYGDVADQIDTYAELAERFGSYRDLASWVP